MQAAEPLLEQKQLRLSAVEKARREIEERQKKIDDVQERINNIEDDIYAPLGKAVGICKQQDTIARTFFASKQLLN